MRQMKRSSVEQWIENVEETGCLEPDFKQNTNDEMSIIVIFCRKSTRDVLKINKNFKSSKIDNFLRLQRNCQKKSGVVSKKL